MCIRELFMFGNKGITILHIVLVPIALTMMSMISPSIMFVKAQVPGVQSSQDTESSQDQQQQQTTTTSSSSSSTVTTLRGAIASTQNNNDGKPTWIAQGTWNMTLAKPSSQSDPNPTASAFLSSFGMAAINGSSKPKYTIYDFKQTNSSMNTTAESPIIVNGVATISAKKVTMQNVPIGITLWQNNVLHLWIDPQKTNNRFGQMPIYGTIYEKTLGWLAGG